ncbi:MOSC, beta barrel [Moelleriella libera RCEF 2490]|uniref:MOSC, beta barrel n=1 Tax=Moelleriella libera RCEF 2490 TaxID=1081109 RepID=A0A167ZM37_9HYPO|nr:MOSC, beta barrel [Moelleriella libera RCEF 2490]
MLLSLLAGLRGNPNASIILTSAGLILTLSFVSFIAVVVCTGREYVIKRKLWHLRQAGLVQGKSNMSDQYESKYDASEDNSVEPIRIKAIFVHPIKSCGPVEMQRAMLTKIGLLYDRQFAIASQNPDPDTKELTWRFISQRTKPAMSLIQTELWLPHDDSDPDDVLVRAGGCLVVRFPDPDPSDWRTKLETLMCTKGLCALPCVSFIVPLDPKAVHFGDPEAQRNTRPFSIHGRTAHGIDMGSIASVAEALPKLKRFLGLPTSRELSLFKCTPETLMRTTENLAPLKHVGSPSVHGYTDQQPIHLNSLSSVHDVSTMLPPENRPLNALRFRANFWITGASPYDEETWLRYKIKRNDRKVKTRAHVDAVLSVVCRTSRCTMPNVDPDKGTFDSDVPPPGKSKGKPQPSTTLKQCRTPESGNKSALGYLGMHCVPEDHSLSEARKQESGLYIEVGDEIEVLERGTHLYGSTGNDY